jgi:hypothetical protein
VLAGVSADDSSTGGPDGDAHTKEGNGA